MFRTEAVVVGAGVIGLSIARALAARGLEVLVLETEPGIGQGVSSRNSEVIHAGIYYPAGSLKATLCVAGREMLYARCAERNIPHRKTGKVTRVRADVDKDTTRLEILLQYLDDLEFVRIEVHVFCYFAKGKIKNHLYPPDLPDRPSLRHRRALTAMVQPFPLII